MRHHMEHFSHNYINLRGNCVNLIKHSKAIFVLDIKDISHNLKKMKIRPSVRAKAIFLTFVFLLNTMVGFACSLGIGMGFNKGHHDLGHSTVQIAEHSHPPGTKKHGHSHAKAEQHDHPAKEKTATKDNCCKDEVAKFVDADKQLNKAIDIKLPLLFPVAIVPAFLQFVSIATGIHSPNNSYFVRHHHPPISDIRIAVQSFQI